MSTAWSIGRTHTRLQYGGLTPQEWLCLHGQLPIRLQQLVVDDHADLSTLVAPAAVVVDLLDWFAAANENVLSPGDRAAIEQLRQVLCTLKVSA